jgi:hypothetical protein
MLSLQRWFFCVTSGECHVRPQEPCATKPSQFGISCSSGLGFGFRLANLQVTPPCLSISRMAFFFKHIALSNALVYLVHHVPEESCRLLDTHFVDSQYCDYIVP